MRQLITDREIIELRDQMTTEELREITTRCKEKFGFVDFKRLFLTMGYKYAYNDKYFIPQSN